MIRPRWKKVLADLWSNKTRSALVIASIAVGLFAVGLIDIIYNIISTDMPVSYGRINPANIQVRAAYFDNNFVDRVKHLKGVKDALGITSVDLRLETGVDQYIPINIKAIHDFKDFNINQVDVLKGSWPPKDKEIALEINKLTDTNANLGDEVEIKLPSGVVRKMKVTSVVHDQSIGSASGGGGFFLAPVQGYITSNTLDWLEQPPYPNLLYATASENPNDLTHLHRITDEVLKEFDVNGYNVWNSIVRQSTAHPNSTYVDALSAVLFILGLLVVFLSGFLITNTMSALLNQQIQLVGVMKSMGASQFQVSSIYMVLILTFSLIALVISIPLANQAAYWELEFLASRINFNVQGYRLVTEAILLQTAIALIVPQLAGAIPILKGTHLTIQEAISGAGANRGDGEGIIYHWLAKLRGLSRPMLISLRNTFRRKGRLVLTLITLILGGAIFIATFNVRAYLNDYVNRLGKYFIADANLSLDRPYRINEIQDILYQVPGVETVEAWAAAQAELLLEEDRPGESVNLQAPPFKSKLIEPMMLQGRWLQSGDENAIVLSELFFQHYPNLKVGDTIRLKVNDEKTDWKIVGEFQFAGKSAGLFAYTDYDSLSRLTHSFGKSFMYRVVGGSDQHTSTAQKALGQRLEAQMNSLGYRVNDIRTGLSLQESTSRGFNILTTFLLIIALMMAAVGSIGLMGTMSLNVLERTREIGIMRAIGASDRAIMNMVIVEGIIIGLVSWASACLVAIPISKLLSDVMSEAIFNSPSIFTYTPTGLFIWLGVVVFLSVLASVIPARNASRLTIREVLAYE